jgi:hypothetical protein
MESLRRGLWYILVLFPKLRTLYIRKLGTGDFEIAPQAILYQCTFFATLECLYIGGLYTLYIPTLSEWILVNASIQPLGLTHFKLFSKFNLPKSDAASLLRAMRTAPLEVLALEGLKYSFGSPTFINEIATTFPNLHGLTLIIRANDRQKENKSVTWPRRPVCALAGSIFAPSTLWLEFLL